MGLVSEEAVMLRIGREVYREIMRLKLPYLPMYKSIPCISWPPILKAKNRFFLFLGENFLEKLIFYLRIFFEVTMVTQKICPELFWS